MMNKEADNEGANDFLSVCDSLSIQKLSQMMWFRMSVRQNPPYLFYLPVPIPLPRQSM